MDFNNGANTVPYAICKAEDRAIVGPRFRICLSDAENERLGSLGVS